MSTETVLIQANEPKTTKDGKTYHLITAGGKKYSCWESGAAGVKPGESWKVEIEQKGNFWNITKLLSQETTSPGPPNAQQDEPGDRDAVRVSIERQVALKAAVELAGYNYSVAGKSLSARDVMAVANAFAKWLETGLLPVSPGGVSSSSAPRPSTLPRASGASTEASGEQGEEETY